MHIVTDLPPASWRAARWIDRAREHEHVNWKSGTINVFGVNVVQLTPVETDNGFALIYLYKNQKSYYPNPENDWNLIYQYALIEKQNRIFTDYINKIKNKTYINIFYN